MSVINEARELLDKISGKKRILTQYMNGTGYSRPTMRTEDRLEPGVYIIKEDVQGEYFAEYELTTDDLLRFSDSRYNKILEEIDDFWKSRDKYSKLGFVHKRGVLLYGAPGTGKSCLLKQVMENKIKDDGVVFITDYNSASTLVRALRQFREVEPDREVLVIMEDVDRFIGYDERTILSLLDGDAQISGVLYLGTTNYLNSIPPRLLRANRFDRKVEIKAPPASGRLAYLQAKIGISEDGEKIVEFVDKTKDFTFAQMREFLVSVYCLGAKADVAIKRIRNGVEESHVSISEADLNKALHEKLVSNFACKKSMVSSLLNKIKEAKVMRMKVGDNQRVGKIGDAIVVDVQEYGGVETELYKSKESDKKGNYSGAVRIIDIDAMEVVGMKTFLKYSDAGVYFAKTVKSNKA